MVGAELQTDSMTGPAHTLIELWQLGWPPDGESSVQTVIMAVKPRALGTGRHGCCFCHSPCTSISSPENEEGLSEL